VQTSLARFATRATSTGVAALIFFSSYAAQAATTYSDLSSWKSAVGSYNEDISYGTENDDIIGLTLDDGTSLSFDQVTIFQVPTGWSNWSPGYTGQVLGTALFADLLTVTFGTPIDAFGFFSDLDAFGVSSMTLTLSDGSIITQSVNSDNASFFGFTGTDITGFSVSTTTPSGFAIGDFYTAATPSVPEPGTWAMMLLGFGAVGLAVRRTRTDFVLGKA